MFPRATEPTNPTSSSTAAIVCRIQRNSLASVIPKALLESFVAALSAASAVYFSSDDTKRWPYINAVILESVNLLLRIPKRSISGWPCEGTYVRAAIFAYLDFITRGTLLHELGHFTTMEMVAENARPNITLQSGFLSTSGLTTWGVPNDTINYTQFGLDLGHNKSMVTALAGGDFMTCLWSLFALTLAQCVPSDYAEIRSYLRFTVIMSAIMMFADVLGSLNSTSCNMGNDDCEMRKYGVDPMAIVGVLLLMMLVWQVGLHKLTSAFCPSRSDEYKFCKDPYNYEDNIEEVLDSDSAVEEVVVDVPINNGEGGVVNAEEHAEISESTRLRQ
jgi:hypothetical protein